MTGLYALLTTLIWCATFAALFAGALRVGPASLNRLREHPGLFGRTLLAVWIFVPVFTIVVVLAFRVSGVSATMLVLMAVCPGLPLVLTSTRSVRASISTAFLALLLTAATEPVVIPYWTGLLTIFHPLDLRVPTAHVLRVLLPTVFLPIVLGFGIRALWRGGTLPLARASDVVYFVGTAVAVVVITVQGFPLLRRVPMRAFVAAAIITIGDALIGYWLARPNVEDQKAIVLAVALGNPALVLAVEVSYPEHQAAALVAAYLIVRAVSLAPIEWWLRQRRCEGYV